MKFAKALRKKAKLRLALTGPSGSGKTYGALEIAKGLGGKTAVIDTEKGSASLYSDRFNFDVLELDPPFTPERFIEAIGAAQEAGYDNLIID
ncbi:TPA: AAA family ATPase, partial [Providencia alcalifaciens]